MLRRIRSLLPRQSQLPKLTFSRRVIDKIVANAMIYDTETGETLIGLKRPKPDGEPDFFALDTIPPDQSASRGYAHFEQGDDLQGDKFTWLADNWDLILNSNTIDDRWKLPLSNLGDWHKHPGTLVHPSWGDTQTAYGLIGDQQGGVPHLLVILATVWNRADLDAAMARLERAATDDEDDLDDEDDERDEERGQEVVQRVRLINPVTGETVIVTRRSRSNTSQAETPLKLPVSPNDHDPSDDDADPKRTVTSDLAVLGGRVRAKIRQGIMPTGPKIRPLIVPIDNGTAVRIDSWYMSRTIPRFIKLQAQIAEESTLPTLPRMNWTLEDVVRSESEITGLQKARYAVSSFFERIDDRPALYTCFTLAKAGSTKVLICVTETDYPKTPPRLYTAPMAALRGLPDGADLWGTLWKQATPLPADKFPFKWTVDKTLLDAATALDPYLTDSTS